MNHEAVDDKHFADADEGRPVALPVCVDGIRPFLRHERRWAAWRYVWQQHDRKSGRWTKPSFQVNGYPAKSDDSKTWCGFQEALKAYRTGRYDGITYALGSGSGGLDVDDYLGHEWPSLDNLPCYRERSPGGQGLKFIGRSSRMGGEIDFAVNPPAFTTWEGARFFTITGQGSSGDPTADLEPFINKWFPAPEPVSSTREGYTEAETMSDDDLLCHMIGNTTTGEAFLALWRGEMSAHGDDHSKADFALLGRLAWWCNYNVERIDRLFQQSKLYRKDRWKGSYKRVSLRKVCR